MKGVGESVLTVNTINELAKRLNLSGVGVCVMCMVRASDSKMASGAVVSHSLLSHFYHLLITY